MALYSKERGVTAIIKNNRYIAAVYRGTQLLWQYIRSCLDEVIGLTKNLGQTIMDGQTNEKI